jgi:host factor-I protein
MGKQEINIQDAYLFQYLKAGSTLRVDLTTGRTLEGKLKRFDRFALVLEHGGREVLVYKHAIATMEQQTAD